MNLVADAFSVDAELAWKRELLGHANGAPAEPAGRRRRVDLRAALGRLRAVLRDFAQESAQGACPTIGHQDVP